MKYTIAQGKEKINSIGGLALIGLLLKRSGLKREIQKAGTGGSREVKRISDVLSQAVGLISQGRTDYNDIELFRDDELFRDALEITKVYSEANLRQRLDEYAGSYDEEIERSSLSLLGQASLGTIKTEYGEYIPYDVDVSPFDNSKSNKEGVSRTYKGTDGFAPIFGYLGTQGYMLNTELRPGKQHCQEGTATFLREGLAYLKKLGILDRVLLRMDSGNDASENIALTLKAGCAFVIKRNLRKENKNEWLDLAKSLGEKTEPRPGKTVYTGTASHRVPAGLVEGEPVELIFEVTERTQNADGQELLIPEIKVDTYWTSLGERAQTIIELYHQHGTSEQFHSELKSDLDLERLPSGKFKTNATFLQLGMLAYNILRRISQGIVALKEIAPVKLNVARRRIRSVLQDMIYVGCKLVSHAGQKILKFGRGSPWFRVFRELYASYC
ncbi:MAG: IS1380 family transposase [Candidatus Cloacimonadota bacterium]|nr:IS1380 family transposase [Candidatus Cloacimonadota bacterium]